VKWSEFTLPESVVSVGKCDMSFNLFIQRTFETVLPKVADCLCFCTTQVPILLQSSWHSIQNAPSC